MGASGWDNAPAPINDEWKADTTVAAAAGGDGFEISEENVSKHADRAHDGGCRFCHEEGHFVRDCPSKPADGAGGGGGECFNCGEVGHNKVDCPKPRVEREFTGECRVCAQPGHRAADCPTRPPQACNICREPGHVAAECTVNRMLGKYQDMKIEDVPVDAAWVMLEKADQEKDLDDIKTAIYTYAKAFPKLTYQEIETAFRDTGMNTHLIAKQQEIATTQTIINLQGKRDLQFVISFQFSDKPRRAKFAEGWPKSPEENLERLAEAGIVMDGLVIKCSNCNELGHGSKQCTQEKVVRAEIIISCANCDEDGHRARDCTKPRKSASRGCKNCGGEGHIAKECPEPPNPENVECRNCNQMGHFSKDCPDREPEICRNCLEEGHRAKDCTNDRVMKCHNCDEIGHASRECPLPRDYSRVECSNCHEKGHTKVRCKAPPAVEAEGGEDGYDIVPAANGGGDGGW